MAALSKGTSVRLLGLSILAGVVPFFGLAPAPVRAQVPRVAPPPPCRVQGVNDPLLPIALRATRTPSLAVLPFTQGVVERKYSHVPWMLAERVRESLRRHPGLVVASSGQTARAIFASGGVEDSARKLLAADWMVIGTVESNRLDARVRITLLEGRSQKPVWTHEFLLADESLAAIEDMVVDSISARVARRAPPASRTTRLSNKDLDHRFSAAQLLLNEHTLASTETARAELEAIFAIDTAPAVAVALARATALMLERSGLQPPDPAAALRRIDALVAYALARQPGNAGAWTSRAIAARFRDPVRFEGAEAAHRRAIALDARSADAAYQYAVTLFQSGRSNESRLRLRRALDLDASHPQALALLAEVELRSGRPQLTCAFANAAIAADPFDPRTYGTRALARLRLAQAREAYADAETAMGLTDGAWAEGIRLMVEVAGDNTSLAQSLGRQYAQTFVASRPVLAVDDALSLARAFAALGFDREAEGALLKARPAGQVLRVGLSDTAFNRLRGRPAFAALLRSIPLLR